MRTPRLGLLCALLLAGCPTTPPPDHGDQAAPIDAAVAGDLAGCQPACGGLTPKCNAKNHCVGCLVDGDCPMGSYCKVASDTMASCAPGCSADANCANGQKCCGMRCVDTASDPANCGGCGTACGGTHQSSACAGGKCMPGACADGWGDCNQDPKDGCEANLHADPANCTGCGMACKIPNAYAGCADGCYAAACKFGFDDCNNNPMDGCETKVAADPKNCGACGRTCTLANAIAGCVSGNCVIQSCAPGYADCDGNGANGCEVAVGTDPSNCGKCGNVCPQGNICKGGGCTCPMCNIPNASANCVNNMCVFAACNPGFGDCNKNVADGCEVNLSSDKNNCGACGNVCPLNLPNCGNGMCTAMPICQRIGWKFGMDNWACPNGYRMPTVNDFNAVAPCITQQDQAMFDTMHDIAVDVGGCNCKWNMNWCGQPSIDTIRQGRMCGDYNQLQICIQ